MFSYKIHKEPDLWNQISPWRIASSPWIQSCRRANQPPLLWRGRWGLCSPELKIIFKVTLQVRGVITWAWAMINDHDTMEVSGGKLVFLGLTQDGVDQYQIGHVVVLKSDVSPLFHTWRLGLALVFCTLAPSEEKKNGAVKNIVYDPFGLNISCFYLAKLVVYCDGFFQSKYWSQRPEVGPKYLRNGDFFKSVFTFYYFVLMMWINHSS